MSSALAMASVTAVLKNLLENGLIQQAATLGIGDVMVTALPPDRIPTGSEERTQLNLYLYRVTPNAYWRRSSISGTHDTSSSNPSLALDLHYLLTAYAERDVQAEIVLGHAIQVLHERSVLTPQIISSVLASISGGSANGAGLSVLSASTLAGQPEPIKLSTEFLSVDDMSKLWSSLQTRSRLSVTYLVSMIVIEDRQVSMGAHEDRAEVLIS